MNMNKKSIPKKWHMCFKLGFLKIFLLFFILIWVSTLICHWPVVGCTQSLVVMIKILRLLLLIIKELLKLTKTFVFTTAMLWTPVTNSRRDDKYDEKGNDNRPLSRRRDLMICICVHGTMLISSLSLWPVSQHNSSLRQAFVVQTL